jgi:hypothetical protein
VYSLATLYRRRFRALSSPAIVLALLALATCLAGCVSIPLERVNEAVGADELSAHVHFLSQPALKGRKPKTRGSAFARRYIRSRFENYGLVPWGQARRFAQPFGAGTNIIGVLPGADPNLRHEMVIVAAHFDHLGKTERGVYPGACDNASGVAALLEIAESLTQRDHPPRRSVCFAAFDCEETFTLGAFAFACREDFDESRIAGVVNIDMLGRDGFAVLDNHLFMTGTQRYPGLRRQIQSQTPEGITVLPMGTEIAGPRGDHVAFETLDSPVLFFTCGPHEDYHRPSDTPGKLDFESARRSVDVITGAVEALANSNDRYRPHLPRDGDREELEAIRLCLAKIRDGHEAMGWTQADAGRLDPIVKEVERLRGLERYTRQDRLHLLRTAAEPLVPLMIWPDSVRDPNDPNKPANVVLDDSAIVLQTLYTEHRVPFVRAARALVKDLLSQRTSFLLGRTMRSTVVVMDVPDHLIFLETVEPSQYRLEFLFLTLSVDVRVNDPSREGVHGSYFVAPGQCTGTMEELTDYSLLLCRRQVQRTHDRMWLGVLRHVTGATEITTYQQALQKRLAEGQWSGERDWILDCARSENAGLRYAGLTTLPRVLGREAEPVLLGIFTDPNAAVADRQAAVVSLDADASAEILIAVTELLSDQTEIKHRQQRYYDILTRPSTPFEGYPLLPLVLETFKRWIEEDGQTPRRMSDLVEERLSAVTKQDFDKDAEAWREWIETNWPLPSD